MRWIIRVRTDYGEREFLSAVISVNASEGGASLEEAIQLGFDVLKTLGGDAIDEPGDKLKIQVEAGGERGE